MRAHPVSLVLFAVLVLLASTGARASEEGSNTYTLDGRDLTCTDYLGRQVRTYAVAGLGDAGWSEIFFRMPVIKLDPDVLRTLPGKMQVFFFLHECGHHKLGHLLSGTGDPEPEADCWAVKTGRDSGFYRREDVVAFGRFFALSNGTRAGHLPGPKRHAFLLNCFDQK